MSDTSTGTSGGGGTSGAGAAKGKDGGSGRYEVKLRVYDLSGGLARQMSMGILGKQVDGIWHTGILVHGREIFFGGGIQALPPSVVEASFGIRPVQELVLGRTDIDQATLNEYLRGVSPRFTQATYNLLTHNCNNFSDEVSRFLLGKGIPEHIVNLPNEVLSTPLGQMLAPMVLQMQNNMYGAAQGQGGATDPFSMLAAATSGGVPAAAPVAAPAPAPAPAAAPAPAPAVAAVPASDVLASHDRPLVSADTSVLKVVADRLVARGAVLGTEEHVLRAAVARLVSKGDDHGTGAYCMDGVCYPGGKVEEGVDTQAAEFVPILARIVVATDKTAGPALCLLRSAVLDPGFLSALVEESTALRKVVELVSNKSYTTVTPHLMALASLANLVASDGARDFLKGEVLAQVLACGLQALASDNTRANVRQLGAALLHNAALKLPTDGDGAMSDDLVQVLCALCDGANSETDAETVRRRLLGIGLIVKRAGGPAAELMEALELSSELRRITTNGAHSEANRALCAEVLGRVAAATTA